MEVLIREILHEIKLRENCRILPAVESGSCAWSFASPDSDHDVRFSNELGINGWDVDKALRLLCNSNPAVFEWFSSPIVYKTTPFADRFRPVMMKLPP